MAASSSAAIPPPQEKYDVFLSFRGEDTRATFTSHLHAALCRKKIETYIDDRLERGDGIAPALLKAIQKSKFSVIIFSKNYASSTWCLDELLHIMECKERYGQIVLPIFYNIDPSDVRKQQGSYADAFSRHEERFKDSMDKVLNWRVALTKAANLCGFDNSNNRKEADLVETVVNDILSKWNREMSSDLKGLVGIESRIKHIESLLCLGIPDVCAVIIWGMGGIGKTTLADRLYHRLCSKFEASCFLKNVGEDSKKYGGLDHLRNKLLRKILDDENLNIDTPSIGSTSVGDRLRRTKVLIVLDDVSESSQLELLLGDHVQWFGLGSRIIITTRDRSLLKNKVDADKIYKVEGLNSDEALQLFQLHAFRVNSPRADYTEELSRMVVNYAGGVPLALIILGSLFLQCESKQDWEDLLNKLKKFPSKRIQDVLRLSYDRLEENEKGIFLDIACFHKGVNVGFAKRMLDFRGFCVVGISILIDMALISIARFNCLEMHDLVQEMGWAIVREQCTEEPGKRSRLFAAEDVRHVLENETGTAKVEAIFFNMMNIRELHVSPAAFRKMYNLEVLKIDDYSFVRKRSKSYLSQGLESLPDALRYLYWEGYPSKCLPSKFSPENLVELQMPYSQVEQFWNKGQNLRSLKIINLRHSKHLTEVPDLSGSQNIENIRLYGCTSLVQVPSYFQYFGKLTVLRLGGCSNLKYLPEMPDNIELLSLFNTAIEELPSSVWSNEKMSSLDITQCKNLKNLPSCRCNLKCSFEFSLVGCSSLHKFSELPKNIRYLDLTGVPIEVLPSAIECLFALVRLKLSNCKNLVSLPTSICKLKSLLELDLNGCSEFEYFPEILEPMDNLMFLCVEGTAIKGLPTSICKLKFLRKLDLSDCSQFQYFPEILEPMENLKFLSLKGRAVKGLPSSICKLKSLERLDLTGCSEFECFPENFEPLEHLKSLCVGRTSIKGLPSSICKLKSLETLDLTGCSEFEYFPEIFEPMEHMKSLCVRGTSIKGLPTSICKLKSLEELDLRDCSQFQYFPEILEPMENLKFLDLEGSAVKELPSSICKLKSLERLDLTGCSEFEYFPEILEPMEHLDSLTLDGTGVKGLTSSIGNLFGLKRLKLSKCQNLDSVPDIIYNLNHLETLRFDGCLKLRKLPPLSSPGLFSLKELDLGYCGILEIPDRLVCLNTLIFLNLSGTLIESIPASIKQAYNLREVLLKNCKSLQSLPQLPPSLSVLQAHGCTSLKTVSSSHWNDNLNYTLHVFSNCLNLDQNGWSNIMTDAHLRITQFARCKGYDGRFSTLCWGDEIPNWFSYQSEGCSLDIKLPPNWFRTNFLGFAVSLVVEFDRYNYDGALGFECTSTFKSNNDERYQFNDILRVEDLDVGADWWTTDFDEWMDWWTRYDLNSDHVFVGLAGVLLWQIKYTAGFSNGVTDASFYFRIINALRHRNVKVKKCGICLLYDQDAEKFDVISGEQTQKEDGRTKRSRDESEASGSGIFSCDTEQEDEPLHQGKKRK